MLLPTPDPACYNTALPGKLCSLAQWWHGRYCSNHLLPHWTGGFLHRREFMHGAINLVKNQWLWGPHGLGELTVVLLNSHIVQLLSDCVALNQIRDASYCSGQWVMQRLTTGQSAENSVSECSAIAGTSASTFSKHSSGNIEGRGAERVRELGAGREAVRCCV